MKLMIHGRVYEETEHGPVFKPCAPHSVIERLGDKWTIMVMSLLAVSPNHRLRFSDIKARLVGISQRMLTVTLRNLERDGLVRRHYFAEMPPRVEYDLTSMGASMLPALQGFTGWIRNHWPSIEAARLAYDHRSDHVSDSTRGH